MGKNSNAITSAKELRRKAELECPPQSIASKGLRELHEIQVHKIELEMQNEELCRAVDELREHEEHLCKVIKNNPVGYFHLDPAGRFLEVNDAWLSMHGYDNAKEVIGKHFSEMQIDLELDATIKHMADLLKGVPVPIGEYSARHKDGSIAYHTFSAHPIVNDNNVVGLEWFIIDTTERNLAERELLLTEGRMSNLIDLSKYLFTNEQEFIDHALHEIIKFTNSKIGYIYSYNEKNRQFTLNSWSSKVMEECAIVEQQTIFELDKTGIWGEAVRQRKPILLNDFQAHNALKKDLPSGHVPLKRFLTIPVIIEEEIVAVVGVANKESDYTDAEVTQLIVYMDAVWKIVVHKRTDLEMLRLSNELHQAQKMESVGRLAGGVAHDFNNMLSVILGYSEMALMHITPNHPMYDFFMEIKGAANRSAALTKQLLAFARKQTIAPEVINLNEAITEMLKMLQRLIGENIKLTWKQGVDLWPVMMDTSQIDQIMANLCVNARDAIYDVGEIIIETENCSIDESYCKTYPYFLPGDYVKIVVSDNGEGMDKETVRQIFEPFFTTKGIGIGTGLGLATVYGIVKQNNGFINVNSEQGTGTTFSLYLPRNEGKSDQVHKDVAEGKPQRGHETILIVEDEHAILEMTSMYLTGLGYNMLKACSPSEAIRLASEHNIDIDLLVTDVIMPEMNGEELTKRLLSFYPQIKNVFMSGYTADIIARHGVLDKGIHFIQKPFKLDAFAAKIREVLDN